MPDEFEFQLNIGTRCNMKRSRHPRLTIKPTHTPTALSHSWCTLRPQGLSAYPSNYEAPTCHSQLVVLYHKIQETV